MNNNQLQDHTKLIHLINGICRGIEIDTATKSVASSDECAVKEFPDYITIQGKRVEKNIAFGAHTLVLPSVLLRSDVILKATYGKSAWDMLYEKSDKALAGFQSMGEIDLEMCMLKITALGAALSDMIEIAPDGSLDFTKSLLQMKHIIEHCEKDSFTVDDIANELSVQVTADSLGVLNAGALHGTEQEPEMNQGGGSNHV